MADSNLTMDTADTTVELVALAKSGHAPAIEALYRRSLPRLRRWASGRLPGYARDLNDTQDLVHDTLLHTLARLDDFEVRGPGAFQAYLRRGVLNRICDEIRRATRRPESCELVDCPDPAPSPLELAIGREVIERYEAAFARLSARDQAAITLRLKDRLSYDDIARSLGKSNASAARMTVSRAVARLIAEMNGDGAKPSPTPRGRTSRTTKSSKQLPSSAGRDRRT
jgi:RNA polymerase sigma factor (sigma-70 family)